MSLEIASEADMRMLGAALATACEDGLIVYLQGPLGSGKTTLVRGFLQALGYEGGVRSPTYTLVEPYRIAGRDIYHFDLYRLGAPEELEYLGLRDYLVPEAVWLVEWPERGQDLLPAPDLRVRLEHAGSARRVELTAETARGRALASTADLDKRL
ncbi:MAG: tRNA (adenosine(37)-N6)-threonylcarbamoyltransferase complex ATPase subunit type 1 TsaE [Chromatiales bacterium]